MKVSTSKISVLFLLAFAPTVLSASSLVIEDVRKEMPSLVMPLQKTETFKPPKVVDSDPESRAAFLSRIESHNGFQWKDLSNASRIHFAFDKNEYQLDAEKQKALEAFVDQIGNKRRFIVYGFCDSDGNHGENKKLSKGRAESAKILLEKEMQTNDYAIKTLSSTIWPGDPEKARRVEIIAY